MSPTPVEKRKEQEFSSMPRLNVEQKSVESLFSGRNTSFLIPDYQRPYSWGEEECQTLWDDIFSFAFPNDDYTQFKPDLDEYYLGSIVTFRNGKGAKEVIDGQQRLTTLCLLLRVFYAKLGNMQDQETEALRTRLGSCIWNTNEFGILDMESLKIDSNVVSQNDRNEFLSILNNGIADLEMRSKYAQNYRFFSEKVDCFVRDYPAYFRYLPARIMGNCILLPIEADNQDMALKIFSTLNDRGLPLSDSDIFKSKMYGYYETRNALPAFVARWRRLEELCIEVFSPSKGSPMDELFTKYMYYLRAKRGVADSTTQSLRKFFELDNYGLLRNDVALQELEELAEFWKNVKIQSSDRFSDRVLRRLFVLAYAPNGMWTYFVSVYFLKNKDANGLLDDEAFFLFLCRTTAFIWAYTIERPGVGSLRGPMYAEMVNIVNDRPVSFEGYRFDSQNLRAKINSFEFPNARPMTKSMLAWWAFNDDSQKLFPLETPFDIEHIVSRNRQVNENLLIDEMSLESLGNKVLLEKRINIRASDYRFNDKKRYYLGYRNNRGVEVKGSGIHELSVLSELDDFDERSLQARYDKIVDSFMAFLDENHLLTNR